jgi:predicted nucleotidyltransferase
MRNDPAVEQVWCVGSYARGDWGVGSDIDIVVILTHSDLAPNERYRIYYPSRLPVPADLWVHTLAELETLAARAPGLWRRILGERIVLASGACVETQERDRSASHTQLSFGPAVDNPA